MTLKWANHDKWLARLKKLAPSAQTHLNDANEKSAMEMAQLARALVPVKTGKLRDSIAVTPPGQSPPRYSQGALPKIPDGAYAVSAGNQDVRYAHLVEYGTKPHEQGGMFEGAFHPGTMKNPFFWPAYRTIRKKHRGRVGRAFSKSIKATKNAP